MKRILFIILSIILCFPVYAMPNDVSLIDEDDAYYEQPIGTVANISAGYYYIYAFNGTRVLTVFVLAVGIPLTVLIAIRIRSKRKSEEKNESKYADKYNDCLEKYNPTEDDLQNIGLKLQEYLDANDNGIVIDPAFEKPNVEMRSK